MASPEQRHSQHMSRGSLQDISVGRPCVRGMRDGELQERKHRRVFNVWAVWGRPFPPLSPDPATVSKEVISCDRNITLCK